MEFSRAEYWSGRPSLLQGTFPTQGSNPGLPHCRQILCQLSHKGSFPPGSGFQLHSSPGFAGVPLEEAVGKQRERGRDRVREGRHVSVGGCARPQHKEGQNFCSPGGANLLFHPSMGLYKRICPKGSVLYKYTEIENHQTSLGTTVSCSSQFKLDLRSHGDEALTHEMLIKSVISSFYQAFPLGQAWLCTLERPSHLIPTSTLSSSPLYKGTSR